MMEAQLVLVTLVQRVTFERVPGQQIEPEPLITLRPTYGELIFIGSGRKIVMERHHRSRALVGEVTDPYADRWDQKGGIRVVVRRR